MEAVNPFLRPARPAWAALPEPDRETGMVAPDISSPRSSGASTRDPSMCGFGHPLVYRAYICGLYCAK